MKTMFTSRKWVYMVAFLCSFLLGNMVSAQRTAAKCAGFTAKITNGSVLDLCSSSSITLSAAPVTTGYTFQWQIQTSSGRPFESISGATGATYTAATAGAYRVYISTGSCVDTSGITSVMKIIPEGGKITPATTSTICPTEPGGLIKGTVVPGIDLGIVKFSWERNENNSGWTTITDASDISYNAGPLSRTTSFRRLAKDNCGNIAYSNTVTLSIAPDLIAGTVTPLSQTINRGQNAAPINSTAPASGGTNNYNYQWQWSYYERGPWENVLGASSSSYSPGAIEQTTYYRRLVTDVRCFTTAITSTAVVFVNGGILNPGNFVIYSQCFFPGNPASTLQSFNSPSGGVAPYTIQWQSSTDNVNFTNIAGAINLDYPPGNLTQTTYFRRKVKDAAGTVAYTTSEVINMISSSLTGGTIMATANVACLGSEPATIGSISSPTGYAGLSYQWQYKTVSNGNVWTDIPNQVRDGLYPDPITEKTWFRRVAIDRCGSNTRTANSNEVEIDIRPAVIAGDIEPTSQMIRSGATPKPLNSIAGPSGGTGSYTISWENASLAVGPWTTISSASTAGYQPPALTQSAYYRRVVKDNNCLATKYTYVVEVYLNNTPPVKPGNLGGSQCAFPGNTPGLITTGSISASDGNPPYTYSWEKRSGTSGTWTPVSANNSETYQPSVIAQTTQYRRKVTDLWNEFAYSDPITIEYHTAPLNGGTIVIKSPTVICAGSTAGLIENENGVSGYGENSTYQWQIMVEGGIWTNIAGANKDSYQPGTITKRTHFRRVATDKCGTATRTAYSNEVIFDLPVAVKLHAGLVDGPFITCVGSAPGTIKSVLEACGGGSPLHYQWEVMNNGVWQTIAGATSANYTPSAINNSTTYRRKAYDNCGNVGYSNEVEIFVYSPIEPGVIGTETQTVCINQKPEKIRLLTNCHYTDGTIIYQWQSSNSLSGTWNNISNANAADHQPAASSTSMYYRLMVRSTTCSAVAYTNIASVMVNGGCQIASAIVAAKSADEIKVYPNPLTGNSIKVEVETKGKVIVRLLNAQGQAIPVAASQTDLGLMTVSFTGTHSKGMYLLTVSDEKSSWTKKIIVQ